MKMLPDQIKSWGSTCATFAVTTMTALESQLKIVLVAINILFLLWQWRNAAKKKS